MAATIYYESDADASALSGQRIAVLGFGSQGHAHALNLQDSGHDVVVGLREGSSSVEKAREAGLRSPTLARRPPRPTSSWCCCPTRRRRRSTADEIAPNLKAGDMLMFAHGFNIHFGTIEPPADVDVTMIAPKGPGHLVRRTLRAGDRDAGARRRAPGRDGQGARARARVRGRDRRGARGRHRDHLQGGDRDRPVRRADDPVRRHERADQERVRDARRRRATSPRSRTSSACTS